MPSFIEKQYGPFTGGVWIVVIGGGIVLAIVLRRAFAGGGQAKTEPAVVIEDLPSPRVFGDIGQYGQASGKEREGDRIPDQGGNGQRDAGTIKRQVPKVPTMPDQEPRGFERYPITNPKLPRVPTPITPTVPAPAQPITPVVPTIPIPKPPEPVAPVNPADEIPGGFPADCTGVQPWPNADIPQLTDTSHAGIDRWFEQLQRGRAYHIAYWTAVNIATNGRPAEGDWENIAVFFRTLPAGMNLNRRQHGLRALKRGEIDFLLAALDNEVTFFRATHVQRREFMYQLFEAFYGPFLCNTSTSIRYATLPQRNASS